MWSFPRVLAGRPFRWSRCIVSLHAEEDENRPRAPPRYRPGAIPPPLLRALRYLLKVPCLPQRKPQKQKPCSCALAFALNCADLTPKRTYFLVRNAAHRFWCPSPSPIKPVQRRLLRRALEGVRLPGRVKLPPLPTRTKIQLHPLSLSARTVLLTCVHPRQHPNASPRRARCLESFLWELF